MSASSHSIVCLSDVRIMDGRLPVLAQDLTVLICGQAQLLHCIHPTYVFRRIRSLRLQICHWICQTQAQFHFQNAMRFHILHLSLGMHWSVAFTVYQYLVVVAPDRFQFRSTMMSPALVEAFLCICHHDSLGTYMKRMVAMKKKNWVSMIIRPRKYGMFEFLQFSCWQEYCAVYILKCPLLTFLGFSYS